MVGIKKISIDSLEELVRISYKGDVVGFNKYHVEKFDFEGAVERTMMMIRDMEDIIPCKYYSVMFNEKPIGYIVVFEGCLYSFAIAKEYRIKPGVLRAWWALVILILNNEFVCMLYKNNTRAIRFLRRMGMTEAEIDLGDKDLITLVNI